jgi:ribosome-associated protein
MDKPMVHSSSTKKIIITPLLSIDEDEIQMQFIRASGPGGQNVNKVSTAVQLRFDVRHSPSLPENVRTKLMDTAGQKVTKEGVLIIDARRYRSQEKNRQDARERLVDLIQEAAVIPKKRIKTRPSLRAKKQRLETKRQRSRTKKLRRSDFNPDD